MTPEMFIASVVHSMQNLTARYAEGHGGGTYLGAKVEDLGLNEMQKRYVWALVRLAVGEATHNLICGIEGQVTMGSEKLSCTLLEESGLRLTGGLSELLYEKLEADDVPDTAMLQCMKTNTLE